MKPYVSETIRKNRLCWAHEHEKWTQSDWDRVCWSDESSFILCWGQVYVTRRANEALHPDCLVPRFRGYCEWMVWACIIPLVKGPLVFIEKDWGAGEPRPNGRVSKGGTVTGRVMREKILPYIRRF